MGSGILFHWSPKGGSGTSVVAAATAVRLARDGADVVLVDCDGDQAALLGLLASSEGVAGLGDWSPAAGTAAEFAQQIWPRLRLLGPGTTPAAAVDVLAAIEELAADAVVVVDAGADRDDLRGRLSAGAPHVVVCVMRLCYLAISRARGRAGGYGWVTLVCEPGRSLRELDIAAALGATHVE